MKKNPCLIESNSLWGGERHLVPARENQRQPQRQNEGEYIPDRVPSPVREEQRHRERTNDNEHLPEHEERLVIPPFTYELGPKRILPIGVTVFT